jgi:hypothetical protein
MDSPVTTPSHTPTFSPLASTRFTTTHHLQAQAAKTHESFLIIGGEGPFVASPSTAVQQQQRTPQQPGGVSSAPSGLSSLTCTRDHFTSSFSGLL